MIGELPDFIDRAFFIGFVAPVLLVVPAGGLLLHLGSAMPLPGVRSLATDAGWLELGLGAVTVSLIAVLLLVLNRQLMRLLEGYGPLRFRGSPLVAWQRWRWQRLRGRVAAVAAAGEVAEEIRLTRQLAQLFPHAEAWLLPTAFGNAVRAYEVYPVQLYGVEAVWIWPRLLAVVSEDFRKLIEGARSLMNFWVSAWGLMLVLLAEWLVLVVREPSWPLAGCGAAALATTWLCTREARSAAIQYGEMIKAAFDVYLPELGTTTQVPALACGGRREAWTAYSQATGYRQPEALDWLKELPGEAPPPAEAAVDASPKSE